MGDEKKFRDLMRILGLEEFIPYIERPSEDFLRFLEFISRQKVEEVMELVRRYGEWKRKRYV